MARTGANRGNNQHSFAQIPRAEIQRSTFNRSCGHKTTISPGILVPVYCDEALPGDTFNLRMSAFCRMATPLHPIMDNQYMDFFFFFVPNRLIWTNWEKFNGAQDNPDDSTTFTIPQMVAPAGSGVAATSLSDYIGIPQSVPGLSFSSLWHRAYNLIWNEWFRDQNLQDSVVVDTDDGPDTYTDYTLLRRGKRHDYFTSCLPFPQKGPDVTLPLGVTAPLTIVSSGAPPKFMIDADQETVLRAASVTAPAALQTQSSVSGPLTDLEFGTVTGLTGTADLSGATAATINELREAFQIQRMFERDARGGTRYTEIIRSHFNVISPDGRLQRPEFLGGGSIRINVNPVAQTTNNADLSEPTYAGTLGAFVTGSASGEGFRKSFTEHGVLIGMVCVRADLNYQQGLERQFSRLTRFDFFWPSLAHLGEQAVLNKEIYAQGTGNPTADADVFGYQERYAEYRYKPSRISGLFNSNYAQPLDSWHLAQDFSALPELNASFIVENPPITRVIAVTSEPAFLLDTWFQIKCARPMPVFGVPGLIDHF